MNTFFKGYLGPRFRRHDRARPSIGFDVELRSSGAVSPYTKAQLVSKQVMFGGIRRYPLDGLSANRTGARRWPETAFWEIGCQGRRKTSRRAGITFKLPDAFQDLHKNLHSFTFTKPNCFYSNNLQVHS